MDNIVIEDRTTEILKEVATIFKDRGEIEVFGKHQRKYFYVELQNTVKKFYGVDIRRTELEKLLEIDEFFEYYNNTHNHVTLCFRIDINE